MPHFVDAVDAGATLGEICNVLRDVFGTYRSKEVVLDVGCVARMQVEIDHVAIVVKDLEATVRLYTRRSRLQGDLSRGRSTTRASRPSAWKRAESVIELLRPLDEESPVARFRGDAATDSTIPPIASTTSRRSSRNCARRACD